MASYGFSYCVQYVQDVQGGPVGLGIHWVLASSDLAWTYWTYWT